MTRVERRELAPGLEISCVLTGMWQLADMERDGRTLDVDAAVAAMRYSADAGFTTFDMADHYGRAEEVAGAFRASGASAELLTKWVPPPGPVDRASVRAAVETARGRLGVECIDLLQFHAWNYADLSYLDALRYLSELRAEGLVRHIGLTNFDTAHLRIVLASGIEIASNQVAYSLIDRRASGAMTELCSEHGVHLLAYGTLGGGFLSERYLGQPEPRPEELDTWSQMKYLRFIEAAGGWDVLQKVLGAASEVAGRHGVSIANVACRYVLEEPAVAGIIIGARLGVSEHLEDNERLFSFALSAEDRALLDAALAHARGLPGDCGDEYRRPPFLTASGDLSDHLQSFPAAYAAEDRGGGRSIVLSGTPWESVAGYSRAVRQDDRVHVSGTTATHGADLIGGGDPAAQTHFVIDKIEAALRSLGARLEDVVRTRVFVNDITYWEPVARAHGERFRDIQPANTLVEARLVGAEYLVEIEAEAIVRR